MNGKNRQADTTQHVATNLVAERLRQLDEEGWTVDHDDQHADGEIADAAACYAASGTILDGNGDLWWPWDMSWLKRGDRRRDLVKAGALIIAEIERLDRLALKPVHDEKEG